MNKCKTCDKKITGVEKWYGEDVYCFKCSRSVEKEKQRARDHEIKNWYKPGMTDDEYYHKVFDLFC